jgi:single-stranded-DNA-specific exonuclease
MQKRWLIKDLPDASASSRLQQALNVPLPVAQLLIQRGIHTFEEAKDFFRPDLTHLHDPFEMKGMREAVERILRAKEQGQRILVFGDYDVDGTTAVALMVSFLRHIDVDTDLYIPDRYSEGYGLSIQGIDYAHQTNCSILLTLDCGIKAVEKIDYARGLGLDVIVCDHHTPGDVIPDAIVLDPKQDDCPYPYKELSGCGIGYKLAQALTQQLKLDPKFLESLLDLVAISIAADIVPVTGENRILAYHGLSRIHNHPLRPGIKAMLGLAKKTLPLTFTNVVFVIAPRINAAGRIHSGRAAVELLLSNDDKTVNKLALSIESDNTERKELDREMTEEILENLAEDADYATKCTTVVYGEHWHKGVIGIVASRLIETYYRPTIVLTKSGDVAAGSVRSVSGFDVYNALEQCADCLIQFGGHKYAAGLTMRIEDIPKLQAKFEEVVSRSWPQEERSRAQLVDLELAINQLFRPGESHLKIPKLLRILNEFEPFGPQQMKPVFLCRNVYLDPTTSRIVGDNHLKTSLYQPGMNLSIEAIGFDLGHLWKQVGSGEPADVLYTLESNTWNERTTLQLNLKDIRPSEAD